MTSLRALVVLACLAGTAHAEDNAEELRSVAPFSMSLGAALHSSKLSGLNESGGGPNLELALGHRRWQYFVEGSVAWVGVGPEGSVVDGKQLRGGIGVRWLAQSFELDRAGALEMNLEAFTGVQKFYWEASQGMPESQLVRFDIGVGVGWQVRMFVRKRQLIFRSMARVSFAPAERDSASVVCRGTCTMPAQSSNSGLTAVIGFQW